MCAPIGSQLLVVAQSCGKVRSTWLKAAPGICLLCLNSYAVQKKLANKMYKKASAVLSRGIKTYRKVSSHRLTSLHNEHVSDPGTLAKLFGYLGESRKLPDSFDFWRVRR